MTGYLRARSLSVNQLVIYPVIFDSLLGHKLYAKLKSSFLQVHISGAGDYQLCKVDLVQDPCPLNIRKEADIMDSDESHCFQVCLLVWCLTVSQTVFRNRLATRELCKALSSVSLTCWTGLFKILHIDVHIAKITLGLLTFI